jgi:Lon protease-like protein
MSEEIALFPIPGIVAFPGQTIQLHIFEPRYRQMVADADKEGFLVGVCLPGEVIRKNTKEQKLEEVLNSNQTYYEPAEVLGCGSLEVEKTMEDGRILLNLNVQKKVRLLEQTQIIPYQKGRVEEVIDRVENPEKVDFYFNIIVEYAIKVLGPESSGLVSGFIDNSGKNLLGIVNKVVSWPFFSPKFQQEVLELEVVEEKARRVIEILEKFPAVADQDESGDEQKH